MNQAQVGFWCSGVHLQIHFGNTAHNNVNTVAHASYAYTEISKNTYIYIWKDLEGSLLASLWACWRFQFKKAPELICWSIDSATYLTRTWIQYCPGRHLNFNPHLKSCHSCVFHCCHHTGRSSGLWQGTDELRSTNWSPKAGDKFTWIRSMEVNAACAFKKHRSFSKKHRKCWWIFFPKCDFKIPF